MWLGGVSVFGSFAARYSSEAALCGNTRNICHKQTPSRYDWKTVESDVKHHSLTHSLHGYAVLIGLIVIRNTVLNERKLHFQTGTACSHGDSNLGSSSWEASDVSLNQGDPSSQLDHAYVCIHLHTRQFLLCVQFLKKGSINDTHSYNFI